ncbi:ABC transporter permease [Halobacillus sp. A5]|uniref:ABC transporter permease n=1 Tax=Halobacillus sp. A5 TaxID=2880263 RepID=UPI0020A65FC4|nr:ABC transporter permease [Halobacillus sp. A5]MCP3028654.1 ABC transporter permease [Halobacillus sp. A5]
MLTFLIKDLLLFWRDRKEVVTVILLPLLLVVVLSVSMSGLFDEDQSENFDLSLGLVIEDDQDEAMEEFEASVTQSEQIPDDMKPELIRTIQEAPPVEMITEYLTSPELEHWLTVQTMSRSEVDQGIESGNLDAGLIIPENYTAQLLKSIHFDEENKTELSFIAEKTSFEVDMVHNVIQGFLEQMNLQYAISASGSEINASEIQRPEGATEMMADNSSFTISIDQYFTISMGALFVLFMASTVATRTGIEKREHTFNRIALTNTPAFHFLFGKTFATFILSWMQIVLIFIGSHAILGVFSGRSLTFWMGLIFMASIYSFAIAGLSSILTSISLRLKNPDTANGIFMAIIIFCGTIGGNFIPIYILPNWLQEIGEWTPNGLTLAVLMEWLQVEDLSILWMPALSLLSLTLIAFIVCLLLYPKRGEIS